MSTSDDVPYSVAIAILKKYYGYVKDLRSYLACILTVSGSQELLISDNDSQNYIEFLKSSYVGIKDFKLHKKFGPSSPLLDMRELVDNVQERIFRDKRSKNIITSGYRLASHANDNGKKGMTRIGITNYFLNTVITAFQAPEWETLLSRVGEDVMIHLLTETSLFMSLPNGCLCQLAGEPLINILPPVKDTRSQNPPDVQKLERKRSNEGVVDVQNERPLKRPKLDLTGPLQRTPKLPKISIAPVDISFVRFRLFYSRPDYVPNTNRILVGLPTKHILTRLNDSHMWKSNRKQTSTTVDDPRLDAERTRKLSKYIFPRQYGLISPFHSKGGASFIYGDYLDRELELKTAGSCKTPKRLKDVLPILEKMIKRHARCGFIPLRDRVCPSKIKTVDSKDFDSSVILEMMSETSVQLKSQLSSGLGNISLDSSGKPIAGFGLTQAQKYAKQKPRFVEFACSHIEVFRYVSLVTRAIIPKTFWGSKANMTLVLHYVKEFIRCRRYETLNLHHVLQKFSTASCDWLIPPGPGAQQQGRVSVSDALKRRELLEDFLFWYFDSFVLPLLKATFYVTDSSAFGNTILYFRHDDWTTLCAPLIERLTSATFEKLSDDEAAGILRQRKLGYSFVRLLPKDTGVRPIVNLRRRKTSTKHVYGGEQSINQILQAAFSILTYERTNQPKLLGASIFNRDDIHLKLKKLKAALPRDVNGALPKLYFLKLDVQACFDTIEQSKLLQVLREVISEDIYMIQKYGEVRSVGDKVKRVFVRKAVPEDDHPHFLRYAADLAGTLRNIVFVDQVVYPLSKKQEILQLLEEHITENIVKIGSTYYRQMIGIPQGSILSTILCCFFYGDLEKRFGKFTDDPHSALLRLTDDYLFITTNLGAARSFLKMMKKGHPEYGCFIAQEKTLTNFNHDDPMLNVLDPSEKYFPWCGLAIGMQDLSVTVDYSRYHKSGIGSALTVDRGRRSGASFTNKLIQLAKAKSHAIFSDQELNSKHVVYLNVYQNLLLTAIKMVAYISDWGEGAKRNTAFLRNVIQKTIVYNYTSVRMNARRKGDQNHGTSLNFHREAVVWLGNHAFHYILSRTPQKYRALVVWLDFEMGRMKWRAYDRRFKALVQEGQRGLAQIVS